MHSFLDVRSGDIVCVQDIFGDITKSNMFWIASVLNIVSGAREPSVNSIFQVANIDTGEIIYINANLVKGIVQYSSFRNRINNL